MQEAFKPPEPLRLFPEKLFYKIGEVSRIVSVETYVLRYWETEFSFLSPRKGKSGQRVYTKKDIDLILQIKKLLYDDKYTIDGVRQKLGGSNSTCAVGTADRQQEKADAGIMETGSMENKTGADALSIISMVKKRLQEILRNNFGA
jgi:DNA-binding transcriptional MerR regulator